MSGRTSQGHGPENSLEVWLFGSMGIPRGSSTGPGVSREAVDCYDEGSEFVDLELGDDHALFQRGMKATQL